MANSKHSNVDWASLEADYRAGSLSLRALSAQYEVSKTRIAQVAKEKGWEKDLKALISARAQAKLDKLALDSEGDSVEKEAKTEDIVEANADLRVQIVVGHRKTLDKYQQLAQKLLEELEVQTSNPELFSQLAELLHAPDDKGVDKLNEIYKKVMSTPSRIDSFKKLAETYKTLIGMERQAFGLSDNSNGDADKPPEKELSPTEAARFVAFALMKGANQ